MLELVRIDTGSTAATAWPGAAPRTLAVGLARTAEEVEQIQRLRYDVFTEDMGAVFPQAQDGVEQDRFDQWCEHLMVRELDTGRVVGTYRILTPEKAREAGGYYSESEFDLSGLGALREAAGGSGPLVYARRLPQRRGHHAAVVRPGRIPAPRRLRVCAGLRQRQPARRRRDRRRSLAQCRPPPR